jgi:hypothetical protein
VTSIEFPRPDLPAKASAAVFNDAKLAIVEWCSPRSFRVESGLAWLAERAFGGEKDQNFWWVGPDYASVSSAMTILKSALTEGCYTIPSRTTAFALINGTVIYFRSAENVNALYADDVFACVIDQAIHVPEKAWRALQETLANTRAPARIVSTVAGTNNWFNELARKAEDESEGFGEEVIHASVIPSANNANSLTYSRFSALDALAEGIIEQEDIDYARASLPDHIFRALYLAVPYDPRIETAHKAGDPKLMTDAELAVIANLDPGTLHEISDSELEKLGKEV